MASINVLRLINSLGKVDKSELTDLDRQQLLAASQELLAKLENPWDTIKRLVWINPCQQACLRTLVDLKLFEKWVASGGGKKTVEELGELVGCHPKLLERLLRMLVATHLLANPLPNLYSMNEFSASLAEPTQHSAMRYWYDINIPMYTAMPQYLSNREYKEPSGTPATTAFNWGKDHTGTLFDYWAARPKQQEDFDRCMKGYAGHLAPWTAIHPTEKLLEGTTATEVLVVDVGGGTGHDLQLFQKKHRTAPGQLVLQDQAGVIARAQVDSGIKAMAHDFMTPQPVKGARAYYMHSVLHDWPDDKAKDILSNLKPALKRGFSKVLIHEVILWPQGNSAEAAQSDVMMMTAFNSAERSVEMWETLVESAGYKVSHIYTVAYSTQSVIELELA